MRGVDRNAQQETAMQNYRSGWGGNGFVQSLPLARERPRVAERAGAGSDYRRRRNHLAGALAKEFSSRSRTACRWGATSSNSSSGQKPGDGDELLKVTLPVGTTLDQAERELIDVTLRHTNNNKTRAADILGISIKTLFNKLRETQSS